MKDQTAAAAKRKPYGSEASSNTGGGYAGKPVDLAKETTGCALEIARRPKGERGFKILAKRWAVERTLGAAGQASQYERGCRRLRGRGFVWR